MSDKERIDYLLLDIRELEKLIAGMRNAEIYPASFFSQSFELTHKIMQDLHTLEFTQIQHLQKQMAEHQAILNEIPHYIAPKSQTAVYQQSVQAKQAEEGIIQVKHEIIQEKGTVDFAIEKTDETPKAEVIEVAEVVEEIIVPLETKPVQPEQSVTETTKPLEPESIPGNVTELQITNEAVTGQHAVASATTTVSDKIASQSISLNEILEKKNFSDFRKAFSLNDRFYFRRELFAGNETRMNQVIAELNEIHSYEDSVTYLDKTLKWNIEDKAVSDFVKLLEKRFS